jgi:hypothetical protein
MTFGWELVFGIPSVETDSTLWYQYDNTLGDAKFVGYMNMK